ncbi:hypothetical protein [Desulforamulus aquiferis]|uniref:Methyltransferase domain-containing protein n=1 Tax=Desulforamulus aquiferis TaxID=1397668 RepID=A0AAW7Z9A3_9FIRM|nr:hypothetical protein [Desulforamulus aquiferis]MDO7785829.1 hypothetical protein [Desulforamulus aquiferis]
MIFTHLQSILNQSTKDYGNNWTHIQDQYEQILKRLLNEFNPNAKRILLLGAGNGNDLPLSFIEETFDYIEVVDIDKIALNRLLQKLKHKKKFSLKVCDFTGLDNCNSGIESLISEESIPEKVKLIEALQPNPSLKALSYDFDIVMNCNFSTQLLTPITPNLGELPQEIGKAFTYLSDKIHCQLFEQIKEHLKADGLLLHSSDVFELSGNRYGVNPAFKPLLSLINYQFDNLPEIVNVDQDEFNKLVMQGLNIIGSLLPQNFQTHYEHLTTFRGLWYFKKTPQEFKIYIVFLRVLRAVSL